jgi:hypothetical protein
MRSWMVIGNDLEGSGRGQFQSRPTIPQLKTTGIRVAHLRTASQHLPGRVKCRPNPGLRSPWDCCALRSGVESALRFNAILSQFHPCDTTLMLSFRLILRLPSDRFLRCFTSVLYSSLVVQEHASHPHRTASILFCRACFPITNFAILHTTCPSRECPFPWGRYYLLWLLKGEDSCMYSLARKTWALICPHRPCKVKCAHFSCIVVWGLLFPHICYAWRLLLSADCSDITKWWTMSLLLGLYPRQILSAYVAWQQVRSHWTRCTRLFHPLQCSFCICRSIVGILHCCVWCLPRCSRSAGVTEMLWAATDTSRVWDSQFSVLFYTGSSSSMCCVIFRWRRHCMCHLSWPPLLLYSVSRAVVLITASQLSVW